MRVSRRNRMPLRAQVEARYIAQWKLVHLRGFIFGIIVPIILELVTAVSALVGVYQTDPLPAWPAFAKAAWTTMCVLAAISALAAHMSFNRFLPLFDTTPEASQLVKVQPVFGWVVAPVLPSVSLAVADGRTRPRHGSNDPGCLHHD